MWGDLLFTAEITTFPYVLNLFLLAVAGVEDTRSYSKV